MAPGNLDSNSKLSKVGDDGYHGKCFSRCGLWHLWWGSALKASPGRGLFIFLLWWGSRRSCWFFYGFLGLLPWFRGLLFLPVLMIGPPETGSSGPLSSSPPPMSWGGVLSMRPPATGGDLKRRAFPPSGVPGPLISEVLSLIRSLLRRTPRTRLHHSLLRRRALEIQRVLRPQLARISPTKEANRAPKP